MSRFKSMPGVAWLVIGVCVTALVLPTAAYASGALKFSGIEGTSGHKVDVSSNGQLQATVGGSDGGYAEVTNANQLQTALADPSEFYQPDWVPAWPQFGWQAIANPTATQAIVLKRSLSMFSPIRLRGLTIASL